MKCVAVNRFDHTCSKSASEIKEGFYLCGTHANLFDEYVDWKGILAAIHRLTHGVSKNV